MTDNKLTNEQIIKVLELCLDEGNCKECLCYGDVCITDNDVLTCLKRQQAEIEQLRHLFVESGKEQDRLMAEIERLKPFEKKAIASALENIKQLEYEKSETIKEFAERLKTYKMQPFNYDRYLVPLVAIDEVAKEMTELANGKV